MNNKEMIQKYYQEIKPIPPDIKPVFTKYNNIKVVLFDVYGTLLHSDNKMGKALTFLETDADIRRELTELINQYQIQLTPQELITQYQTTIRECNQLALKNNPYPEVNIIHIWSKILGIHEYQRLKKISFEFELIFHKISPAGDLTHLTDYLKKKQLQLGIISNAQFYTEIILEFLLNKPLNEAGFNPKLIFYSYRFRTAKPSAKLFALIIKRLDFQGIKPHEALFIGNSYNDDILPAKKAGLQTVFFAGSTPALPQQTASDIQPDVIITNWEQIKYILS